LGGGVILDLIHELDYVRWFGGEVAEVACFAGRTDRLDIDTEDHADLLFRFTNGAVGSIHLDYIQRCPTRTCRIVGTEATVTWDYHEAEIRLGQAGSPTWEIFREEGFQRNDMFVAQMRHFLACLEHREVPVVDIEEGARLQHLAMAAHKSNEDGVICRV
jgi:predicted dehydrogenase